ncbi:MAG: CDP-alcohol phosphatidyltransferase family protein [Gemmatimonadaceae bacterium]
MQILPDWLKNGYLRLMEPIAAWLVRRRVHPNTITIVGTIFMVAGGVLYGTGHIRTGGLLLGITALTDVLDGMVARRSNTTSVFGAFLDSSLDRVADGAVLGGLAVFYALNDVYYSVTMVVICLAGLVGAFMTSYTRARAEALGLDAKVGMLQRPERVVLLSAPQAFFGVALNGWVLSAIIIILTITAWITVVQRMKYVYDKTRTPGPVSDAAPASESIEYRFWERRPSRRDTSARPALKGE